MKSKVDQNDDIEKLRGILLGEQQTAVEELKQRLSNRYQRTQDASEILADAVRLSYGNDHADFTEALSEPLRESIHLTIQQNPKKFVEALYPSILPAIRRSIREMSRQFIEQIDMALTKKFSLKHLRWRMESWRTGVPVSSIILRESISYQVDQLLLIQNGTGLLLGHVYREDARKTDSDAVSGMLWAIESFVRDSFTKEEEGLNRVTMGEYIIYLAHGPEATLASVVQGVAPPAYLKQAKLALEHIHQVFLPSLKEKKTSDGQRIRHNRELQTRLKNFDKSTDINEGVHKNRHIKSFFFSLIVIASLAVLGARYQDSRQMQQFFQNLNQQSGISIHSVNRRWGGWSVHGLADPVVGDLSQMASDAGLNAQRIDFEITPFLSLAPEITLARVTETLKIPASIKVSLNHGELKLEGGSSTKWYAGLRDTSMLPYGIESVDSNAVSLEIEDAFRYLEGKIGLPGSVNIGKSDGVLRFSGSATNAWMRSLENEIQLIGDKVGFDIQELKGS